MKPKLSFMSSSEGMTITQDKYQPGWIMPYAHYHNYYEVYILGYGERLVYIDDEKINAGAFTATLFDKNIPHRSSGTSAFGGVCVSFNDNFLNRFFTHEAKHKLLKCFGHTAFTLREDEFAALKSLADGFISYDENNFIRLADILTILNTAAAHANPLDFLKHENDKEYKSELIFKYIDENYRTIKDTKEISDLFGISQSWLFKLFKKKYETSPKQHINNLKLRHICQALIYQRNVTVKAISANCGFDSYEHFMRLFKQKMGCTPLEYRRDHLPEKLEMTAE